MDLESVKQAYGQVENVATKDGNVWYLRPVNAQEGYAVFEALRNTSDNGEVPEAKAETLDAYILLLRKTLCTESGERCFDSDEGEQALRMVPFAIITEVGTQAMIVNRLFEPEDEEDAKKK